MLCISVWLAGSDAYAHGCIIPDFYSLIDNLYKKLWTQKDRPP